MSTDDRLKPWQPLPALACDRCLRQVTRRITAASGEVIHIDPATGCVSVQLAEDAVTAAALTCEAHADAVSTELCMRLGAASVQPIRDTWKYWFLTRTWPGRIWDWLTYVDVPEDAGWRIPVTRPLCWVGLHWWHRWSYGFCIRCRKEAS